MAVRTTERKVSPRAFTFAGRRGAADECPLCAAYDYTPNDETLDAIRESHENMNLKRHSLAEMISELYS